MGVEDSFVNRTNSVNTATSSNHVVMMQGKNGKPWPTAINPKFLAQTQIGTMIQSAQNMTIVDQLMNDKTKFQEIDMGKFDEDDKQYIYVDIQNKKVYDVRNENHMLKL